MSTNQRQFGFTRDYKRMVMITDELWLRADGNRIVLGSLRDGTAGDAAAVNAKVRQLSRRCGAHTMSWYAAGDRVYVYVDQTEHYAVEELLRRCPEIDISTSIES